MDTIKNALIEKADINGSGTTLTYWIGLDYGDGGHQSFGGYGLGGDFGCKAISRVMQIVGVQSWKDMVGKPVRAKIVNGFIDSLGHFLKDEWFSLEELSIECGCKKK